MADMDNTADAMWRAFTASHETKEIEPGVYEHTFTPPYWGSSEGTVTDSAASDSPLTLDVLRGVLDDIQVNAREYSLSWLTPVETMRQIRHFYRLGQMYRTHPIPRRKIRKCHMRKVHTAWRKGRAHIYRVEQAEQAREKAAMQRLRTYQ